MARDCVIDDLRRVSPPRWADKRRPLCEAQVLPTARRAARFFGAHLAAARRYRPPHGGLKARDKRGFTRQLPRQHEPLTSLLLALGQHLKAVNTAARYVLDSFPVAVCPTSRIARCWRRQGPAYRASSASKRGYS